jgi:hypothetical protein
MFEPRLGAHIHTIRYRGIEYYHCTVVARKDEPNLTAASLDVCKDAIQGVPEPYKQK